MAGGIPLRRGHRQPVDEGQDGAMSCYNFQLLPDLPHQQ